VGLFFSFMFLLYDWKPFGLRLPPTVCCVSRFFWGGAWRLGRGPLKKICRLNSAVMVFLFFFTYRFSVSHALNMMVLSYS